MPMTEGAGTAAAAAGCATAHCHEYAFCRSSCARRRDRVRDQAAVALVLAPKEIARCERGRVDEHAHS